VFGLIPALWSLGPIYNMFMVALSAHDDVFSTHVLPPSRTLNSFWIVVSEGNEAPWNYMMATAIIYSIPPVAAYYAFRRHMTSGLTIGGVKG